MLCSQEGVPAFFKVILKIFLDSNMKPAEGVRESGTWRDMFYGASMAVSSLASFHRYMPHTTAGKSERGTLTGLEERKVASLPRLLGIIFPASTQPAPSISFEFPKREKKRAGERRKL